MFQKIKSCMPLAFVGVLLMLAADGALAGAGGTEFDTIWTQLTDWTEGTLGKIISGSMIIVGIIAGIARQSIMAFAVGIGGGIGLYNAPTLIDNIFTATLENAPVATQAVLSITNGLAG
jgi:conjugal transfer pilus assembly protein TraA